MADPTDTVSDIELWERTMLAVLPELIPAPLKGSSTLGDVEDELAVSRAARFARLVVAARSQYREALGGDVR